MKRFIVRTLGCKVNQCESAAMGCSLKNSGYAEVQEDQQADLIIINTCAVTGKAAMQSRQSIRQIQRQYPGAAIVVTGCYAQVGSTEIGQIPGVDLIVGHASKLSVDQWLPLVRHKREAPAVIQEGTGRAEFAPLCSAAGEHRTRAFLKIQDGCNTRCTYCIVPVARGPSRSMPFEDVIDHMARLGEQNYREVVLTGIHLGAYGRDLQPAVSLANLLDRLTIQGAVDRIRISSIEPTEIDDGITSCMAAAHGRLCPHWHIPLQSGDNAILKRMGRSYTREAFGRIVNTLHQRMPQAAIGLDVLVGFPGEDDAAFDRTYDLIASLPATYLHVFPYSPRPGTPAAGFKDQVNSRTVKNRCQRLRRLGEKKRRQFHISQIDTSTRVLVETARDKVSGRPKGTSDNYLPVAILDRDLPENTIVTVHLEGLDESGALVGRVTG